MKKKFQISKFLFILLFFLLAGQTALATDNPSIYFEGPIESSIFLSDFVVNVFIDTDKPINAVDLEIFYPKDKLKFLSFDNTGSIVDIWQTTPKVLSNGNIGLTGGLFRSFVGKGGLIMSLSFRAQSSGQYKLSLAKSNIYMADGKGTKIPVDISAYTISVKENKEIISLPVSSHSQTPFNSDKSIPELFVEKAQSPVEGSSLIVFYATDAESGIKQTQMRTKKWWTFSSWQDVVNPVLYPNGAWSIEFKVANNTGLENIKSIFYFLELCKKVLIVLFFLTQTIGLKIISNYITVKEVVKQEVVLEDGKEVVKEVTVKEEVFRELPYGIERPDIKEKTSYLQIILAIAIATGLALILLKFQAMRLWKLWFFLSVFFTLLIAFNAFINQIGALVLALVLDNSLLFRYVLFGVFLSNRNAGAHWIP